MQIESVRLEGRTLTVTLGERSKDLLRFVHSFKPGEYDIIRAKKKRSMTANAYLWALVHEIAAAVGLTDEEIYREAVRSAGKQDVVLVRNDSADCFLRAWCGKGVGYMAETEASGRDGYTLVHLYYGSSCYDTAEMARLIDKVVQDARAMDIETRPREEVDAMLKEWEAYEAQKNKSA